jgi:hypothetical protein
MVAAARSRDTGMRSDAPSSATHDFRETENIHQNHIQRIKKGATAMIPAYQIPKPKAPPTFEPLYEISEYPPWRWIPEPRQQDNEIVWLT